MRDDHDTLRYLRLALRGTPLHDQLAPCGEVRRSPNNAYRHRCGQPACLWCRRRFVDWTARRMAETFGQSERTRMVWFKLAAPSTLCIQDLLRWYGRLRQTVRNACRDRHLCGVRAYGAMTPNPLPARLVADADPALLPDQPLWHPELHGFAELPAGVGRQEFGRVLAYSPRLRVVARTGGFDPSVDVGLQIAAHVRAPFALYGASPVVEGSGPALSWPMDWASAYFGGLHSVGGGFRTLTFQRGLRGPQEPPGPAASLMEIEPMPVLVEQQPWTAGWW